MAIQTLPAPRYFLGANSRQGFHSLYDGFVSPEAGDFLWVIKGGPGCGKSSFMKRIGAAAEAAGLPVEYILCSGDPDSLDGVYFPAQRVAYTDGTAPHVQEATYPGAASLYLDLGSFLDAGALGPHLEEIAALNRENSAHYAAAYAALAGGAALLPRNLPGFIPEDAAQRLEKKLTGLAARELRRLEKPGQLTKRFLSARSCRGHLRLDDTLCAQCERIWLLDNELGLGNVFLARLAELALDRGYHVILCLDPLEPARPEAVLLPEAGLGFLADDRALPFAGPVYRHLRLDTLAGPLDPAQRALLRQRRRESALLLNAATDAMARAKAVHDALEAVYHPHVDFAGVTALAEDHIHWLLDG